MDDRKIICESASEPQIFRHESPVGACSTRKRPNAFVKVLSGATSPSAGSGTADGACRRRRSVALARAAHVDFAASRYGSQDRVMASSAVAYRAPMRHGQVPMS
jgi:hypothetical protein